MILLLSFLLLGTFFLSYRRKASQEETVLPVYKLYLAVGETVELEEGEITEGTEYIQKTDKSVTGIASGSAFFTAKERIYEITVSDLYTAPIVDNEKGYLEGTRYTKEENDLLDEVLAYQIASVGYQTRAAAVEAARFLTLRFPYKLHYFYENGRLNGENSVADGEGRYYHTGLYLSEDREEGIGTSVYGPATWGKLLYEEYSGEDVWNGLDCSGFITWVLYNAGYDCGDLGAGPSDDIYDLTDIGQKTSVSKVRAEDLKVGDLCGLDGHIGMIIGIRNSNIYIAEAYWVKDLQVRVYPIDEFLNGSEWDYIIQMDDFYIEQGELSDYWD